MTYRIIMIGVALLTLWKVRCHRKPPDPLAPRTETSDAAWPLWAIRNELDYQEMRERYYDRNDS